jgi:opacity protein-like surface antigen
MSGRFVAASSFLFLAACAVPTASFAAPPWLPAAEGRSSASEDSTAVAGALPKRREGIGNSYTIVKAGTFMPEGDLANLDDGFAAELIFGRELIPFLSIEGSLGYLAADGQFGSTQIDLMAIPLFVNGRVSLPILILELYGGIGIGGIYAEYDATGGFSGDDFVAAAQAFLGLEVGLGRLAAGVEYKYLQSEDTKDDFSIEGGIASLFVSVPF